MGALPKNDFLTCYSTVTLLTKTYFSELFHCVVTDRTGLFQMSIDQLEQIVCCPEKKGMVVEIIIIHSIHNVKLYKVVLIFLLLFP